ncbi:MAG: hypothetical protein J6J86_10570 [Lachnospiraceae bacterium]|nr:hypothetical protein [Lachnospiraceae bacterium]
MRDRELSRRFPVLLIWAMILLLTVFLCVSEKKEFSEQENRYLSSFPEFSWEALKDGDYTADLESYLADHFPFRDFFMGVKTGFELFTGSKEINDVYIAKDGYLIEKYQKPMNTEKIIRVFNSLDEAVTEAEVYLMLVPTASEIYADKLPKNAPVGSQMATLTQIYEETECEAVYVADALREQKGSEEALFYRTDHHWTSYGAYVAYQEFCKVQGFEAVELSAMQEKTVTEEFKGTIYSKVNDYTHEGDAITIYENPSQKLTVHYTDTGEVTDSLYNYEYLEKKDKYSFFLNNIHPMIEITNEAADTERELVLVKDSYANCMVPFLVNHYSKVYVIDPRYYKNAVSELVNENTAHTDILLLYNMNTIDTDLGIGGIY